MTPRSSCPGGDCTLLRDAANLWLIAQSTIYRKGPMASNNPGSGLLMSDQVDPAVRNPAVPISGRNRYPITGTDIDDQKKTEARLLNENLVLRQEIYGTPTFKEIV